MIPVVTADEMRAIDAEAADPVDVLIGRAGHAVARSAIEMLGGGYGRRVVVLAGPGNNGADGRFAAGVLERRGVRVAVLDATEGHRSVPRCDLVVDAAFGTGISRPFDAPDVAGTPVLAVDIASGVRGDTGQLLGRPLPADRTVTFAALKPGLLLGEGPAYSGDVVLVDIGLDVSRSTIWRIDDPAAADRLPRRGRGAHKWKAAVLIVAGGPGMTGAAAMAAGAAQRAGAGMVQLAPPGVEGTIGPVESVSFTVDESRWAEAVLGSEVTDLDRIGAAVVGPGLGTSMATRHQIREFVRGAPVALVVDGDALTALGTDAAEVIGRRSQPTVLTPHDGEFSRLTDGPGDDRIASVRDLAAATGAVVLLKGPTTVVAAPDGAVRLVTAGDERLATAGTGDVLAGTIAALLAGGAGPLDAAAVGAHVHGTAGRLCPERGTIATDVIAAIPAALEAIMRSATS